MIPTLINDVWHAGTLQTYAEKLFHQSCDFVTTAPSLRDLPPAGLLEIAFAGRSNVGKSSLVNALTSRHGLAYASGTPGRTQALNFFNLAQKIMLVDLPGYGYAAAPKKMVEAWVELIKDYLRGRVNLKRVMVLIDSRHGIKDNDLSIMELLDVCAVSYQLVLTKTDKISVTALKDVIASTEQQMAKHAAAFPQLLVTSAEKNIGLTSVRMAITQFLNPPAIL